MKTYTKDYSSAEARKRTRANMIRSRRTIHLIIVLCLIITTSTIFAGELRSAAGKYQAPQSTQKVFRASDVITAFCTTTQPYETMSVVGAAKPLQQGPCDPNVPLSKELQRKAQELCRTYDFPYPIFLALMDKESKFNPNAVSQTNDYGICQINQCNLEMLSKTLHLTNIQTDPVQNMEASLYLLNDYRTNYRNDNYHSLLMRYNMGPTGAERKFQDGIYSTTYSRDILDAAQEKYGYQGEISL